MSRVGFYGDSSSWMNSNDSVQDPHVLSEVLGFTDMCVCFIFHSFANNSLNCFSADSSPTAKKSSPCTRHANF